MSRGSTSSKIIEQKEIEESRLSIYLACSVAPPPPTHHYLSQDHCQTKGRQCNFVHSLCLWLALSNPVRHLQCVFSLPKYKGIYYKTATCKTQVNLAMPQCLFFRWSHKSQNCSFPPVSTGQINYSEPQFLWKTSRIGLKDLRGLLQLCCPVRDGFDSLFVAPGEPGSSLAGEDESEWVAPSFWFYIKDLARNLLFGGVELCFMQNI